VSTGEEPVIVDIYAAAAAAEVEPARIRSWLHRGYVVRYGYDRGGRALVDVGEVQGSDQV
jgi:hypothetical protein